MSFQRNTTREVSHQSDSLVSENKKGITIWERSVKSPLKLLSLIINVMSLVWFWLVVLTSKMISTKLICLIPDFNAKLSMLLMFPMDLKMDSIRPFKSLLKPFSTLSLWRKKHWFQIFSITSLKQMAWLFMVFKIQWNYLSQELLERLFVGKAWNTWESDLETLLLNNFQQFTSNLTKLMMPAYIKTTEFHLKKLRMRKKLLWQNGWLSITRTSVASWNTLLISHQKELSS